MAGKNKKQKETIDQKGDQLAAQPDGSVGRIEQLLVEQAEHNKKMLRSSHVRTGAMVVLAVVIIVLAVMIYGTVQTMTKDVPQLVETAQGFVETAESDVNNLFENLSEIDFESMNETIKGIGSIDFDSINTSIQGLAAGVEAFQQFAQALTNPFGI